MKLDDILSWCRDHPNVQVSVEYVPDDDILCEMYNFQMVVRFSSENGVVYDPVGVSKMFSSTELEEFGVGYFLDEMHKDAIEFSEENGYIIECQAE